MELTEGMEFDTPFEKGCKFIAFDGEEYKNKHTPTGKCRNVIAIDSEGFSCGFSTMMIIGHPDFTQPKVVS
jgi:hypothetical protein